MNKGLGFSRTIKLDWMDVVASLAQQSLDFSVVKQRLVNTISDSVTGKEARRKTIDVLTAIWIRSEKKFPKIREMGLDLFPLLSSATERLWLHYGMTLVCYPIFRNCVVAIGQYSRTTEIISRNMIKDRLVGEYGHLGGLDRSVERINASLLDWGILSSTDQKQYYKINKKVFSAEKNLQTWFLVCVLSAHPSDGLPFDDLVNLPEIFPFNITLGLDAILQDKRFEVNRQGGGLNIVRVNL